MDEFVAALARLAAGRTGGEPDASDWLRQSDVSAFLERSSEADEVVLYASVLPSIFIYTVAVPDRLVPPGEFGDLLAWNGCHPSSSWGISHSFGPEPQVRLSSAMDNAGSRTLCAGEQLVFTRRFEGRHQRREYTELSQRLSHSLGLHEVPELAAWCHFDRRGDVEKVVRMVEIGDGSFGPGKAVIANRRALDEYLVATGSALAMLFDVTRHLGDSIEAWDGTRPEATERRSQAAWRSGMSRSGRASYRRGVQVLRAKETVASVLHKWHAEWTDEGKRYESFLAVDRKHGGAVREISCDPACLASYFDQSDLPWQISPAFFRPEVLLRYKADPEKYDLQERSIGCRNAWHLETYDVNEAGQVHTYLTYLGRLPYEEQAYWKSFNEPPRGGLSARALVTDIKGDFSTEHNPLAGLKELLEGLRARRVPWWTLRDPDLPARVNYPVTASAEEWANEVMNLDKLVVEGLEERWLRKAAEGLGRTRDQRLRALRLAEECLVGCGFDEERARTLVSPLHEVHNLRSQVKGHATGDSARAARSRALSAHGSFRKHFAVLADGCLEAVGVMDEAFSALG